MNYDPIYATIIIIYYASFTYYQYKIFEHLRLGFLWGALAFIPFTCLFAYMNEFRKKYKNN